MAYLFLALQGQSQKCLVLQSQRPGRVQGSKEANIFRTSLSFLAQWHSDLAFGMVVVQSKKQGGVEMTDFLDCQVDANDMRLDADGQHNLSQGQV
eukprot:937646-Amphidinium_carterae.1